MLKAVEPKVRYTAAARVLDRASSVSNLAEGVSLRALDRLESVMRCEPMPPDITTDECGVIDYPKFFEEINSHLSRIESSLQTIDNYIERTEF